MIVEADSSLAKRAKWAAEWPVNLLLSFWDAQTLQPVTYVLDKWGLNADGTMTMQWTPIEQGLLK